MDRRALLGLAAVAVTAKPAAASSGGGSAPALPSYTRLPTVTANMRRPGGQMGVMTVEVGVDTPDAALRTRVAQSAPRLRAAYAAVVQEAATVLLPGAPPDLERLVAQLQAATDRTLGRRGARLLIGTVLVV
ncbi:Tat pathway signal protein [Brevundimonas lenta]|uniref:Flagellar basal body-associated protein FliL n=1 Tax=Brevundimonas lenta TaxID=424796 RepID=A0A7W6J9W6_9CAUL|nr:Tat pathway signal protein [Brevundimonas lenta]MBB4081231.1 flagellar basal body-associated protein FliL [Brevundimonas lenta]